MTSRVLQIFNLLLVLRLYQCSISVEKCEEYSRRFLNQKVSISRPGGASDIGKVEADVGEFPHMVVLGYEKRDSEDGDEIVWGNCGGSLISEQFVLTAAPCTGLVQRGTPPLKRARVGVHELEEDYPNVQEFNITNIYTYPGYHMRYKYNDIALLKLDRPVKFTRYTRPACFYNSFKLPLGLEVSAVGWGRTGTSDKKASILNKVYLDLFSHEECSERYPTKLLKPYGILDKLMVCAGGRKAPKDTCQGDSGSPLHLFNKDDNIYEIVGITSFGYAKCGMTGPSGVYTRVAAYIPWIESIVWPCDEHDQTPEDLDSYIESAGGPPKRAPCTEIIKT